MPVDVVMCGDRNILWGMAVGGRSALESSSVKLNIYIIGSGFKQTDRDNLRRSWEHENCGTVHFASIEMNKLSGFRSTAYLKSKLCYARYFVSDFFPEIERCIYLDTDLIVARDLADVAKLDLGSCAMAACLDVSTIKHPENKALRDRLGLRDERNYFNSGVLVLNLNYWIAHDIPKKLIDLSIEKFHDLHSQDQDALNIIFEDNCLILDQSWNMSQYQKPDDLAGRIIHLIGTDKPWHARYKSRFTDPYYRDVIYKIFYDTLDRTAYQGKRPWDLAGLGAMAETVKQKIPTPDMVWGKVQRAFSG